MVIKCTLHAIFETNLGKTSKRFEYYKRVIVAWS